MDSEKISTSSHSPTLIEWGWPLILVLGAGTMAGIAILDTLEGLPWTLFALWWTMCGVFHELIHVFVATILKGVGSTRPLSRRTLTGVAKRCVEFDALSTVEAAVVRHSGWIGSVAISATFCAYSMSFSKLAASGVVAAEAIYTDLLGMEGGVVYAPLKATTTHFFHCGNFGLIVLNAENRKYVIDILRKMVQVTMMRGAQCGGVITYVKGNRGSLKGARARVVNGKRTNLSMLVAAKVQAVEGSESLLDGPRLYAGHTRFATTSKVTFDGTHPHQWTPPRNFTVYQGNWAKPDGLRKEPKCSVEIFICHNGDFDAWEVDGTTFELSDIQQWLCRALNAPMPSVVDSAGVAGVIDMLRCQGSWFHSLRLAFHLGGGVPHLPVFEGGDAPPPTLNYPMPDELEILTLAQTVEAVFDVELRKAIHGKDRKPDPALMAVMRKKLGVDGLHDMEKAGHHKLCADYDMFALRSKLPKLLAKTVGIKVVVQRWSCLANKGKKLPGTQSKEVLMSFCNAAVDNFFDNDLIQSARFFLKRATGSFGLCVNSSLDSGRQIVFAARGQTMSIAFYPRLGLISYGSEAAATKSPLAVIRKGAVASEDFEDEGSEDDSDVEAGPKIIEAEPVQRLDLDDLGGEICLVDWGDEITQGPASVATQSHTLQMEVLMDGKVTLVLAQESLQKFGLFQKRLLQLEKDDRILPLPSNLGGPDPVGADVALIPQECFRIQKDWYQGIGYNRITAWIFGTDLNKRMAAVNGSLLLKSNRNRIDLLITGCEVSLWVGEQFASDLATLMPNMSVKCLSSNKILGLLGQNLPGPQTGFDFSEETWDISNAVVLIISHSGGTFAPLAVSNLLQSQTQNIYVMTSEWDTQIGKQLRQIGDTGSLATTRAKSRVFSTGIGIHAAEPCSLSVAVTHQLCTQLLLYLMGTITQRGPEARERFKAAFVMEDHAQLEQCNRENIEALELIVGRDREGGSVKPSQMATHSSLTGMGHYWAQHVLEAPRAWCLCAIYVFFTVSFGYPLVSGIMKATKIILKDIGEDDMGDDTSTAVSYICAVVDALIYVFIPQIATLFIRYMQGRPLLHRMSGRSVVIGDIPWVAQCAEAFASKLFACTYSNTGVSFYSGNPSDHLVHRFTHRVVRGALLAVGRPDGRLSGLTSQEASVCLSVNQASSIQNLGVTCESLTIGHNPSKLPLTAHAIYLPTRRPEYLCEMELKKKDHKYIGVGKSANALLGDYENIWKASEEEEAAGVNEQGRVMSAAEILKNMASGNLAVFVPSPSKLGDVEPSMERYFGQGIEAANENAPVHRLIELQRVSMRLYESRIASMQRLISFFVMFHSMGKAVQDFWSTGIPGAVGLGYEMDRTHSIMRIATTASPVSGAALRGRIKSNLLDAQFLRANNALRTLVHIWLYGLRAVFTPKKKATPEAQWQAATKAVTMATSVVRALAPAPSRGTMAKATGDEKDVNTPERALSEFETDDTLSELSDEEVGRLLSSKNSKKAARSIQTPKKTTFEIPEERSEDTPAPQALVNDSSSEIFNVSKNTPPLSHTPTKVPLKISSEMSEDTSEAPGNDSTSENSMESLSMEEIMIRHAARGTLSADRPAGAVSEEGLIFRSLPKVP